MVTRTFSKAYGLAGLRVGYAFAHPSVADVMNRVLRSYGGVTEVEFAWADDESEDPTVVYQRTDIYRKGGIVDRKSVV